MKNQGLNFTIPYTLNGEEKQYYPDFVARIALAGRRPTGPEPHLVSGRRPDLQVGRDDVLSLLIEVTGEARKDKAAKVSTARTLWIPAVNNQGGFGRWAFVEVTDPWDAQRAVSAAVGSVLELK